ncbi:MAG: patatin-like phospholipase family protein [Bdellovibrio sp.]|nr:patatin-like phospholipase family protein [Bdellovibrio sp.]
MKKCGLVLTGGGARGAYQAGALSAVLEICHENKIPWPFKIVSGVSAGGINACLVASKLYQTNLLALSHEIRDVWSKISSDKIFVTSAVSLTLNGLRWVRSLSSGTLQTTKTSLALLNTQPLRDLLHQQIDFFNIDEVMKQGLIESLSMSMVNYGTGLSQVYFQTNCDDIQCWKRIKREGLPVRFTHEHIMATSAIPIIFPPIKIDKVFYGDGSLRDYTPLSPPIKMGADKLLIIGVRMRDQVSPFNMHPPTPAKIFSIILNGILLDALDTDLERLQRINRTVALLPKGHNTGLRPIETFVITPSQMLSEIAYEENEIMPKLVQYLINGLGNAREGADLISYILFEAPYTRRLIKLGRLDVFRKKEEIIEFLHT